MKVLELVGVVIDQRTITIGDVIVNGTSGVGLLELVPGAVVRLRIQGVDFANAVPRGLLASGQVLLRGVDDG